MTSIWNSCLMRNQVIRGSLAICLAATACGPETEQAPTVLTQTDLSIQATQLTPTWIESSTEPDGLKPMEMIAIGEGRVGLIDRRNNSISVLAPSGNLVTYKANNGAGPGDLNWPCCLSRDPSADDVLILWEMNNRRYSRFSFTDRSISFLRAGRPIEDRVDIGVVAHTPDGILIHPIYVYAGMPPDGAPRVAVDLLDTTERPIRSDTLPELSFEPTNTQQVNRNRTKTTTVGVRVAQPYGSIHLSAMSSSGLIARANSGEYRIQLRNTDASVREIVQSETIGPPLSIEEQANARNRLAEQAKSARLSVEELPFGIPEAKAPLANLAFDADGRLWVILSIAKGSNKLADIYSSTGEFLVRVEWDPSIDIFVNSVSGNSGYGYGEDAEGFRTLFRLTIRGL